MSYPKTFVHRADHMSMVVVMNADQEAQLPGEYQFKPPAGEPYTPAAPVATAADDAAFLSQASDLAAEREQLATDRAALDDKSERFEAYIKATLTEADEGRAVLVRDLEAFQADRARFEEHKEKELADIESARVKLQFDTDQLAARKNASENQEPPPAPPAADAPAKRTRKAD